MSRKSTRPAQLPGLTTKFSSQPSIPDFIESALVPARSTLRGSAAVRHMADDLRIAAQSGTGFNEADLKTLGWSARQIATHGADAVQLADTLRVAA